MEVCHNTVSAGWWNYHSFTLGQDVSIDWEFVTEAPVKSCCSGDTTLSVRPTIQGESVHHQEDGVPLCPCTDLGQTSWGEGKHWCGIHLEVQQDLSVCAGQEVAEGIHQKHFSPWPVCDDQVILLQMEEHPLEMCRGCCEVLQADHLKGLMVHLHDECPTVQVCIELFTTIYDGQEFSLNVGIMGLGVCEGLAHKSYGVSILDDAGSEPLEWGITLKGDWFAPIILSEGSEEGFLQLGLDFLEASVGILVPGKAVLLFKEGPEGFSVWAEMRDEILQLIHCTKEWLALVLSGVVSSQRCLESFLDQGSILLLRRLHQRMLLTPV